MSNLKIGPVDVTAGTAKLDTGGLQVGTNQIVANANGSVTIAGGHSLTANSYEIASSGLPTYFNLNSVSGQDKGYIFKTNGNTRWGIFSNAEAEAGANSGSNLTIIRYADNGSYIDAPIVIYRATGQVGFYTSVTVPALDVSANDNRAASTSFVKNSFTVVPDRPAGDSSSHAANTKFVTDALAASSGTKVTTFNGRSGAVSLSAADVINALGYTPISNTNVVTGISVKGGVAKKGVVYLDGDVSDAGSYINFASNTSSGFCVHPQSLISMDDGTKKFAQDVRPGDVLQGKNKVLGLLNSTLSTRTWAEVNGKAVVTSDHLIKLKSGWAVKSREEYKENYLNKTFSCKTLEGMKTITSDFGDPDRFAELAVGQVLSTGEKITSLREFQNAKNHPVIALYTEQDSFFADGVEVASMGKEVVEA